MKVQWIAIAFAMLFLIQVIMITRSHKLRDRHAFFWLIIAAAAVIAALTIPMLNHAAIWLGVSYMPTIIFMVAFFVILIIVMNQTTVISAHQEKIKVLAQEMAYLRRELWEVRHRVIRPDRETDEDFLEELNDDTR